MKKHIKKVWSDPVCSKVIAVAILPLLAYISTFFINWFPAFVSFLSRALEFFLMETSISNWLLTLLALCTLIIIFKFLTYAWSSLYPRKHSWTDYKSDNICNLKWTWDYDFEGQIFDLTPLCEKCCFEIAINQNENEYSGEFSTRYICKSCGNIAGPFSESNQKMMTIISKTIYHKIRTGAYLKPDKR